jgi:hypothetical protein
MTGAFIVEGAIGLSCGGCDPGRAGAKDEAGDGFVQGAEEAVFQLGFIVCAYVVGKLGANGCRRNSRIMYGKTIFGESAYALCGCDVTCGSNLRVNSYWRHAK